MTWRDDKTLFVLCFFTALFTGILLAVVWLRPTDGQIHTVFIGLLGQFSGALMMYLKADKGIPPGSTVTTKIDQVTKTPPVEELHA